MKRVLLLFVLAFLQIGSKAQTTQESDSGNPIGKIVGEMNVGTGFPLFKVGTDGSLPLLMFGLEARYYFPNCSWDVGVGSHIGGIKRLSELGTPFYLSSQHYLAADYNFRINPRFSLFAGLEAGVSIAYDLSGQNNSSKYGIPGLVLSESEHFYSSRQISPYFAPRFGFEAWNRLRGTFSLGIMDKGDSNLNFRLGYVFGGARK